MKEYKYKGYTFRATSTMTTVYVSDGYGGHNSRIVPLYEIDGLKERGKRPFLTSVAQCREYINDYGDADRTAIVKVWKHGEKLDMTYDDICHDLGFTTGAHFVKVTTAGTISFTAGKPQEIRDLHSAVMEKGYRPAKALISTLETL